MSYSRLDACLDVYDALRASRWRRRLAVRSGGRLDRLLALAERVTGSVRLTIAIDPETIEELEAMSSGYQIARPTGRVAGSFSGRLMLGLFRRLAISVKTNECLLVRR